MKQILVLMLLFSLSLSVFTQREDVITFTALVNAYQDHMQKGGEIQPESDEVNANYMNSVNEFYKYLIDNGFVFSQENSTPNYEVWSYHLGKDGLSSLWIKIYLAKYYFDRFAIIYHFKDGYEYLENKIEEYCDYQGITKVTSPDEKEYLYGKHYIHKRTGTEFELFKSEGEEYNIIVSHKKSYGRILEWLQADISPEYDSLYDARDGKIYKTIQIGNQVWMAKNLNYKTNINSWCYHNNEYSCTKLGRLYTWEMSQNVCPSGWHLPSDKEWQEMEIVLGISQSEANSTGFRGTDEGSQLAGDESLWEDNTALINHPAFESSGFTAIGAGYCTDYDHFYGIGDFACWWSSSEYDSESAYVRRLHSNDNRINRMYHNKKLGHSIRCVQD